MNRVTLTDLSVLVYWTLSQIALYSTYKEHHLYKSRTRYA